MLKELTLNEKIGQMMMVGIDGNTIDERIKKLILNYKVGGVILYRKNFKTYADMLKLVYDLKELKMNRKDRIIGQILNLAPLIGLAILLVAFLVFAKRSCTRSNRSSGMIAGIPCG